MGRSNKSRGYGILIAGYSSLEQRCCFVQVRCCHRLSLVDSTDGSDLISDLIQTLKIAVTELLRRTLAWQNIYIYIYLAMVT